MSKRTCLLTPKETALGGLVVSWSSLYCPDGLRFRYLLTRSKLLLLWPEFASPDGALSPILPSITSSCYESAPRLDLAAEFEREATKR